MMETKKYNMELTKDQVEWVINRDEVEARHQELSERLDDLIQFVHKINEDIAGGKFSLANRAGLFALIDHIKERIKEDEG